MGGYILRKQWPIQECQTKWKMMTVIYIYMCHKIALGTDQNQNKNFTKTLDFANVNCLNHLSTFVVRHLLNNVACAPNAFSNRPKYCQHAFITMNIFCTAITFHNQLCVLICLHPFLRIEYYSQIIRIYCENKMKIDFHLWTAHRNNIGNTK